VSHDMTDEQAIAEIAALRYASDSTKEILTGLYRAHAMDGRSPRDAYLQTMCDWLSAAERALASVEGKEIEV
jgi:hypothetical protein